MRRALVLVLCLSVFYCPGFLPAKSEAAGIAEEEERPLAAPKEEMPPASDEAGKEAEMGRMFEQMGPAMGTMMESMMGAMFKFLAKPEVADNLATFTRNYYDALIAKGFSKEEALKIVVSVGVPQAAK